MAIDANTQLTPERLMEFTFDFALPSIIEVAIRHRVFDLLDEGAKTIE
jgi:3-hydroxy-5-methyl-1-naphthoate 3-O-methyltransferase